MADNAVNLSNMLNMMDVRLDRADKQLLDRNKLSMAKVRIKVVQPISLLKSVNH